MYSVLRSTAVDGSSSLQHELIHLWQSRYSGDAWLFNYLLCLDNPDGYYNYSTGNGNFYEQQAYGGGW